MITETLQYIDDELEVYDEYTEGVEIDMLEVAVVEDDDTHQRVFAMLVWGEKQNDLVELNEELTLVDTFTEDDEVEQQLNEIIHLHLVGHLGTDENEQKPI